MRRIMGMLLKALNDGDLHLFKRLRWALELVGMGNDRLREVVEEATTDEGEGALHRAAGAARLEVCSYLVEELRVDVNAVDNDGSTPLIFAVLSKNAAVAKYLLDNGADPGKAANDGLTPLHFAAGIGDCEMVEQLLAKRTCVDSVSVRTLDVNAVDDEDPSIFISNVCFLLGLTPLMCAVFSKNAAVFKCLLDNGADPGKAANDGLTPLHYAAKIGECEIVEQLLAKGTYVDSVSVRFGTPLHLASTESQAATMKILLDHNADCNKVWMTNRLRGISLAPLSMAIHVSSVECVKLLIEAGAVINSDHVIVALMDSNLGKKGSFECLKFLLNCIASRGPVFGSTDLEESTSKKRKKADSSVRILRSTLRRSARLQEKDKGASPGQEG